MKRILCAVPAIIAAVTVSCAGIAAAGGLSHGRALFAAAISLLALLFILNLLWGGKLRRRTAALTYREREQILSREKAAAERDPGRAAARMHRVLRCAGWYYSALLVLIFAAAFFLAPALGTGTLYTVLLLCLVYILWTLLLPLFSSAKAAAPTCELPEPEFPVLFSLIRDAAAQAGGGGLFRVFHADRTVVFTEGNDLMIGLNAPQTLLFTKHELKQLLLREMAYIYGKDIRFNERLRKILPHWDFTGCGWTARPGLVFLRLPEYYINYYYDLFRLTASRGMELKADRFVKERGDPAAYIDACAKSAMWALFREEPCAAMGYYFYEKETPPEDIAEYTLACFRRMKAQHTGRWEKILASELPARIDTRPTLRMRMENVGVSAYHTEAAETDPAYLAELERFKIQYNELEQKSYAADYAQLRRERYLARRKVLFEYESTNGADDTFGLGQLANTAFAYCGIDTAEAFRIANVILKRDPRNAYAKYCKGMLLLQAGEESGVGYLYDAIGENDNFTTDALDRIGSFALKYGKQDLIDEYRKRCTQMLQAAADKNVLIGTVTPRDTIVGNDLPEELSCDVLNFMKEHSRNLIDKIYTAKKIAGRGLYSYIYIVRFRECDEPEDAEKSWEVYREIFLYLDMLEEQFTLYRYDENKRYAEIILRQIPDCCIFEE